MTSLNNYKINLSQTKEEKESNKFSEIINEGGTGKPISFKDYDIFIEQNKYSVCKIIKDDKQFGTGFLCIIPFPDKLNQLPVLITCNHVLTAEDIKIGKEINLNFADIYTKKLCIDKSRKVYTNDKTYDLTIIEIKEDDGFKISKMLEIDNDINDLDDEGNLNKYKNKSIYMIHYPNGNNSLSFGTIEKVNADNIEIVHLCPSRDGSSGSPIINYNTFKVIAIHTGRNKTKNINYGKLLREPLKEFNDTENKLKREKSYVSLKSKETFESETNIRKNSISFLDDTKNEIYLKIKIFKKDIGKQIYYVDNTNFSDWETKKSHKHDFLKELNELNTKVFINNQEIKYNKNFIPKKDGIYDIKIIFSIKMKDCSFMFSNCGNILSIDLSNFDSSCVTRLDHMFYECYLLENLNFDHFYTAKVIDMSYMFLKCTKLENLDISSFDVSKVKKTLDMFLDCKVLKTVKVNKGSMDKIKEKLKNKVKLIESNE